MIRRAVVSAALVSAVCVGYLAGANASWVSNAVYVARVTHKSTWRILDPLHRDWLTAAIEPFSVPPVDTSTDPDEVCINHQCESEQN